MARRSNGAAVYWKRGWAYYSFTWEGARHQGACGTQDAGEAETKAAKAYAEVVSGRKRVSTVTGKLVGLGVLWDEFVDERRGSLSEDMCNKTLRYYGDRFVDYFESTERLATPMIESYALARMKEVLRKTIVHERSYLRQFCEWLKGKGHLEVVPEWPKLPKGKGTRSGPQRAEGDAVIVEKELVLKIIARLPEWSKLRDGRSWPIRDQYRFAYETALRPATMEKIEAPQNWRPGLKELVSLAPIDKSGVAWNHPLTPEAIKILKRHAPKSGLVFGRHDWRDHVKLAASEVLGEKVGELVASRFSQYDFRHCRLSNMLDAGAPPRGVSGFARHTQATTINRYTRPDERITREALRVSG